MDELVIDVQGMTCSHCVSSVIEEVTKIDGVTSIEVDLQPGETSRVQVRSSQALTASDLQSAIQRAGYVLTTP
ncbi:MAG: heavy metal-associated domain-containing protein [Actinomycetota bacterium]|nr:heavy metal-associated domain-containing protein [Actinomycetota bacterium]